MQQIATRQQNYVEESIKIALKLLKALEAQQITFCVVMRAIHVQTLAKTDHK